jgi:20S proteasome alpha/beta subunit
MRSECLNHRWAFDTPLPVSRLAAAVGDSLLLLLGGHTMLRSLLVGCTAEMQYCTIEYGRRPFGVGFIANGYDVFLAAFFCCCCAFFHTFFFFFSSSFLSPSTQEHGPHIYSVDPSANFYDCKAMAIGARSQSARTYLERNIEDIIAAGSPSLIYTCGCCCFFCLFFDLNFLCALDLAGLIKHTLLALRETLPHEVSLSVSNVSLSIVGKDTPYSKISDTKVGLMFVLFWFFCRLLHSTVKVAEYLAGLDQEEGGAAGNADDADNDGGDAGDNAAVVDTAEDDGMAE